MNELAPVDTYGMLSEPATLTIRRLLPGPIERVWAYLTESDLRRRWLASGTMELRAGAPCELVWRNDELSEPPARRPAGFAEENRMQSRIVEVEPPHKLTIAWDGSGDVTFELQRQGARCFSPSRIAACPIATPCSRWRPAGTPISTRWSACANGRQPGPFWDRWSDLRKEYERRLPA